MPLAGLAVNPLAIALAGVVVFGGALWMLAPVGFLAPAFGLDVYKRQIGFPILASEPDVHLPAYPALH